MIQLNCTVSLKHASFKAGFTHPFYHLFGMVLLSKSVYSSWEEIMYLHGTTVGKPHKTEYGVNAKTCNKDGQCERSSGKGKSMRAGGFTSE